MVLVELQRLDWWRLRESASLRDRTIIYSTFYELLDDHPVAGREI